VGNRPRRFADRPRITIRALMCLVMAMALCNGLCMMLVRQLRASGLPTERIHRMEVVLSLFLNAYALGISLYVFYAPWWKGMSRREWLKDYLTRRVPFFILFMAAQFLIRGKGDAGWPALTLIALFVCGPVLLVAGLSVEIRRILRIGRIGSPRGADVLDLEDRARG
jgi:hypothetical protein